jgi:hypothetical protein
MSHSDHRDLAERESKVKLHNHRNDGVRQAFIYENKSDEEIIAYIEENKIDINDLCTSRVHGVYQPIYYLMCDRPQVLNYYLDKKAIDHTKTIDLSPQNPWHFDFLDEVPIGYIKKAHDYGFKLTPNKDCKEYLTIEKIDRATKFLKYGIIENDDLTDHMTESHLKREIRETHTRIVCDMESIGKIRVEENEKKLLRIVNLYEKNDKLKDLNLEKLSQGLSGSWFGAISWTLDKVSDKFKKN